MNKYLRFSIKTFTQSTFSLMFLLLSLNGFASSKMYVHQMQYLKAEQVIPTIKPHLASSTKVSGKDYQLFIEANKDEYQKIMQMLEMLDKKPNNLLIEVRVLDRKLDNWEMAGASIVAQGESVSGNVTRYKTSGRSTVDNVYRLNTMEGYQGYISTGVAFPTHQIVKHYKSFVPKTQYKEAKSGFYVVAQKTPNQGYRVAINAQQQNRQPQDNRNVQTTQSGQTFNTEAGKWILIASTDKASESNNNRRYQTQSNNSQKRWFYLRVVEN